ncbi:hypothetical protein [Carboxylicivirga marina]|uniref:Uncharacterized protein n=1 Tax=Carboxylicivirga marina TaxID=2800988 RepID=A0ABS1HQB1_9BACT|nr:hypothetical protein [Carboxylicivirga marina]MBK3519418.1 hypothetical protein [Carboxylicivirga marina]
MKRIKTPLVIGILLLFIGCITVEAQYASRKLSKKQQAYIDSIKQVEYDYIFPILGQAAYKRGFDLPYPIGAMVNYIWMDQGIVIDNFQLGINGPSQPIPEEFLAFGENRNTSYAINFRPDIWIFPFLNVYGLFGYGSSTTEINLTIPVPLKSIVQQDMTTTGFGVMTGFGLGPLWTSIDANWTWTRPELLEDPVLAKVLGVRIGKTFPFRQRPDRNIAVWIGGMRARMNSNTAGSVKMVDALPPETWVRADEIYADYVAWYGALSPVEQAIVDQTNLTEFFEAIGNLEGESTVNYGMDKAPKEEWNMLVGGQFQLNKHWQVRSEVGIIGDRKSFLASFNYRFSL